MNIKLKDKNIFRKEDFGGLLFDRERRKLFELNETGTFIIENLKNKLSKERIINDLHIKFNISIEKAKLDFEDFLNSLKEKGLLNER